MPCLECVQGGRQAALVTVARGVQPPPRAGAFVGALERGETTTDKELIPACDDFFGDRLETYPTSAAIAPLP